MTVDQRPSDQRPSEPEFAAGTTFEIAGSAQQGLWLTQQLDPASPAYHISHAFELIGPVDVDALEGALSFLVKRHEALRTSFVHRGNNLYQVIHPDHGPVLERAQADDDLSAAILARQSAPFDLASAPLMRTTLWQQRQDHYYFAVTFHHIIADGVSVGILWRELSAVYAALRGGGMPDLPHIPLSYADFAAWQGKWLKTPEYQRALSYLTDRLSDGPAAIDLPVDSSASGTSAGAGWRGDSRGFEVSERDTASLLGLARTHGSTIFAAMLAVYSGVLYRWAGQADIIVGIPVSLRDQPSLAGVVGMFVNTVPIRVHWGDDPRADIALRRVSAAVAGALSARHVPFHHVTTALPANRTRRRSPIVQVMFSLEEDGQPAAAGPELVSVSVRPMACPARSAKFELSLDCLLAGGQLMCVLEYSDQRFDHVLARRFTDHLALAIRDVIGHPRHRVGEWPLHEPEPGFAPSATGLTDDDLTDENWTGWSAGARGSDQDG